MKLYLPSLKWHASDYDWEIAPNFIALKEQIICINILITYKSEDSYFYSPLNADKKS